MAVFGFLEYEDIIAVGRTCKHISLVSCSDELWKKLVLGKFNLKVTYSDLFLSATARNAFRRQIFLKNVRRIGKEKEIENSSISSMFMVDGFRDTVFVLTQTGELKGYCLHLQGSGIIESFDILAQSSLLVEEFCRIERKKELGSVHKNSLFSFKINKFEDGINLWDQVEEETVPMKYSDSDTSDSSEGSRRIRRSSSELSSSSTDKLPVKKPGASEGKKKWNAKKTGKKSVHSVSCNGVSVIQNEGLLVATQLSCVGCVETLLVPPRWFSCTRLSCVAYRQDMSLCGKLFPFKSRDCTSNTETAISDLCFLAIGHDDGTVSLWSNDGKFLNILCTKPVLQVFINDDETMVTVSEDGAVKIWHTKTCSEIVTCYPKLYGRAIKVHVYKQWIIAGSLEGHVRIWSTTTGKSVLEYVAHEQGLRTMSIGSSGMEVVIGTGGDDGVSRLEKIRYCEPCFAVATVTLRGHNGPVHDIVFDTYKLLTASEDGTVKLWDVVQNEPKLLRTISWKHRSPLRKILCGDGFLVSARADGSLAGFTLCSQWSALKPMEQTKPIATKKKRRSRRKQRDDLDLDDTIFSEYDLQLEHDLMNGW